MAGLQSREGHMMIDSVVWAQYINVTNTQTDRQTDSHVDIANAALRYCVGQQKAQWGIYIVYNEYFGQIQYHTAVQN